MKPVIFVEHLIKRYKKATANAVDDISFSVMPGEFFAFLGPNGAGKTTTISILTTTLSRTSGTAEVGGYDVDTQSKHVRERIGVIFQSQAIDANLTAEENIRLHACIYGLYGYRPVYSLMPKAYKKRVEELTDLLGISEDMFKPIKHLSGGMKRKLEIVRGLMHHPHVLFLDEPTSGLDPVSRKNLWEYLKAMRSSGETTIFLTTHYLEEAEDADHLAIMNHGKIVAKGAPHEVKRMLAGDSVLIKAEDEQALENELSRKHILYTKEQSALRVPFSSAGEAQQIMKAIETPLSVLKIHTPTLEDAYVQIIQSEERE